MKNHPASPPSSLPDVYGTKEITVDAVSAVTGTSVGLYLDDHLSDERVIGLFVLSPDTARHLARLLESVALRAEQERGDGSG